MKSYHEYTYNDRNFPIQKRSIAGDLSYAYDPLDNRITDQNGLYVYDNKSQLLKEDYQ